MRARSSQRLGAASLVAGLLLACGRGDGRADDSAEHPVVAGPLVCVGRLTLTGSLAAAREGGVLLRLVEQASGRVLLQRVYDLGDPLWDRREDGQALYYALTPAFAFDARPPVRAPLALEAIHLPPGVAAEPAPSDERTAVAFAPDGRERDLVLHAAASVAGAPPPDAGPR